MSLTKLVLRFAAPVPQADAFERCLFIGPHPDDIEIGAGATAAKFAAAGKKVCFLICLDGRYGLGNAPAGTTPEALVELRRAEALEGARLLGVEDVRFLDLCDGGFYEFDRLQRGIAQVIGDFKPQIVFAPDPDVDSECHADHRNVGEAARNLTHFAPYREIMARYGADSADTEALAFYMTARPNRFVETRGLLKKQLDALLSHRTQFPAGSGDYRSVSLYLKLRAADFGLRSLNGQAEGCRVTGRPQTHGLPEAGL